MSDQVQREFRNLDLALIGNCGAAVLSDRYRLADLADSNAKCLGKTALVETNLTYAHAAQVRISDFAAQLDRFERTFRSMAGTTNTATRLSSS